MVETSTPPSMDLTGECSLYYEIMIRVNHVHMADSRIPNIQQEKKMINFIIWIIVGALIGWVASIIMQTNNRQGLKADIIVGIVGGYFLSNH